MTHVNFNLIDTFQVHMKTHRNSRGEIPEARIIRRKVRSPELSPDESQSDSHPTPQPPQPPPPPPSSHSDVLSHPDHISISDSQSRPESQLSMRPDSQPHSENLSMSDSSVAAASVVAAAAAAAASFPRETLDLSQPSYPRPTIHDERMNMQMQPMNLQLPQFPMQQNNPYPNFYTF